MQHKECGHKQGEDHKHHSHSHGHHSGGMKKILILSTVYMVVEFFGGYFSGSLALVADASHMLIDVAAIALGLFATWIAHKPKDNEKTYGYYRAEILAALVNGATLSVIAIWICIEAWTRFNTPHSIKGQWMTLIAFGGLLVNLSGLFLMRNDHQHNLNSRAVWLHLLTDTLGSVAALVAGLFVWKWNIQIADPIISVIIAMLIFYGSWQLLRECVDVLLEGVPKGLSVDSIRTSISRLPNINEVHDLHVWTVTSGMPSLSVHVVLKAQADQTVALNQITKLLKDEFHIEHVTVQVEPENFVHQGEKCN